MKFICKYCSLTQTTSAAYFEHMRLHQNWKNFRVPCCFPGCLRKLTSVKSFQTHVSQYHQKHELQQPSQEMVNSSVQCPVKTCGENLFARKQFCDHIRSHLKMGVEITCSFCPSKFVKPQQFSVHMSRYHPAETLTVFQQFTDAVPLAEAESVTPVMDVDGSNDNIREDIEELPTVNPSHDDSFLPDNVVTDEIARFYLKLEGQQLLPTLTVQDIAEEVKLITELIHHSLKKALKEELTNIGLEEKVIENVIKNTFKRDPVFNVHHKGEAQEQFGSAHLRSVFWQRRFPYVEPKRIVFGVDGNGKNKVAHYIPLRDTLKILLKDPDIKKEVLDSFHRDLPEDILSDFTHGSAYREHKKQHGNGKCLQILLFQDAFEFNPFGPGVGLFKPIGFYYSLGNISPEYRSKLDLIQLAYLVLEKDLKPSEQEELDERDLLKECLKPLLEELEDLKVNGLNLDGEKIPVCLLLVSGDSLGQHQLGSFVQNFSAPFFCRFCPVTRKEFKTNPRCLKPLRTPEEYDSAVISAKQLWTRKKRSALATAAQKSRQRARRQAATVARSSAPGNRALMKKLISKHAFDELRRVHFRGVKYRPSPLNSEKLNFHVCSPALPPCIAHDLFEGVVKIFVANCLKYFIDKGWFDLKTLNRRIRAFRLKGLDRLDAPKPLKKITKLSGNAVQNWNFLRFLPLIIGDLIEDKEDEVWELYLQLKEIAEYVCAPKISVNQVGYLDYLIGLFLLKMKELEIHFESCFIPKLHFLRHYPALILIFGPLIRLFTLRYESKHMFFKRVVRTSKNFINITYTMAKKYATRFAYEHMAQILPPAVEYDPNHSTNLDLNSINEERLAAIPAHIKTSKQEVMNSVTVKGTKYEKGFYLNLERDKEESDLVVGAIDTILLSSENKVSLLLEVKKAQNSFNGFYIVEKPGPTTRKKYELKSVEDLLDYYPLPSYNFQGDECLVLKHSSVCL